MFLRSRLLSVHRLGALILFLLTGAVPVAASTLHCVFVVNTQDSRFGKGAQSNLCRMWELAQTAALCSEMELQEQILVEDTFTLQNLQKALDGLEVAPDDALLFYFSGHGSLAPEVEDPWPVLMFTDTRIRVRCSSVVEALVKKQARLTLVIAEACNHSKTSPRCLQTLHQQSVVHFLQGYKRLFCESSGLLITCAAQKGQVGWMNTKYGSFFTNSLVDAVAREVESTSSTWESVMEAACQQTVECSRTNKYTDLQIPQYVWQGSP